MYIMVPTLTFQSIKFIQITYAHIFYNKMTASSPKSQVNYLQRNNSSLFWEQYGIFCELNAGLLVLQQVAHVINTVQ